MKKLIAEQAAWKIKAADDVKKSKRTVDPPVKDSDYTNKINAIEELIRKLQTKPKPEVKKVEEKKEEKKKEEKKVGEEKGKETKKEEKPAEKMQDTVPPPHPASQASGPEKMKP